ncbi:MAG TPA: citrate/2-methylcitrate synthase [Kofleriaceae bacterium]|nr:citrate/2-methylcitrate synthase [Kofleriaceae bacterium]
MVDQRRIDDQRWVDAVRAATYLGISVRSLYAYVSRGQVRSVPGERGRPRRYALADLERLRVRRDARAGHGAVAAGALRWGEPVLDSAITAITPRGPAYRGKLAVELAASATPFENVAELLWSGYLPASPVVWPRGAIPLAQLARLVGSDARTPLDVMPLLVQVAALADAERDDARPDALIACGRRLIPLLAAALAPGFVVAAVTRAIGASSVAQIAARAIGQPDELAPVLDRVFVLLADHELNASSFTARIAASTDAGPYACVSAALATMSGPKHGSAAEQVARFAAGVGSPEAARAAVRALRKRGDVPPGFAHPIYPAGDPRAPPLLEAAARLPQARNARTLFAIAEAATDATPNVDFGLAALVAALGAPPATATGLFAVARAAGWLAHALEQRAAGHLLRPRARYIGPPVR